MSLEKNYNTSSVFLLLTHDEFFDAFEEKKFRRLFAYLKGFNLSNKQTVYPQKLFP